MEHATILTLMKSKISDKKYNIHFYIHLICAIHGVTEVEIKKEIKALMNYSNMESVRKHIIMPTKSDKVIPHNILLKYVNYFKSKIEGLELNSDQLLVSHNKKAIARAKRLASITPQSLGLTQ